MAAVVLNGNPGDATLKSLKIPGGACLLKDTGTRPERPLPG